MKSIKKLSLILAAAFLVVGVSMANVSRDGKKGMEPKERAEKMTERMVEEYGLNDTQKKQLLDVNTAFAEKMGNRHPGHHGKRGKDGHMGKSKEGKKEDKVARENKEKRDKDRARIDRDGRKNRPDAPKMTAEEREKKHQEMKKVRDDYNAELQKIMNTEQYQAYTKKHADREQKRSERGENRKENRQKRPVSEKSGKQV